MIPCKTSSGKNYAPNTTNNAYLIAMAGELLQLTSNCQVPTCIHRVIPPKPAADALISTNKNDLKDNNDNNNNKSKGGEYKPRVFTSMFLHSQRQCNTLLKWAKVWSWSWTMVCIHCCLRQRTSLTMRHCICHCCSVRFFKYILSFLQKKLKEAFTMFSIR